MKSVVCFGEIMARLSPPDRLRLQQAMPGRLDVTFAGAEANVAVTLAQLGGQAEFVTALPRNALTEACLANLRAMRVGVGRVRQLDCGRFGLFFLEPGANQRRSEVLYDREGTSFALAGPEAYPWSDVIAGADWFHFSGIAAGVSRLAAEATQTAVKLAREAGLAVSCDLNFRRKLWRWRTGATPADLFQHTMARLLPELDVLIGNAHDLASVIGETFAVDSGAPESHIGLARRLAEKLPRLRWIAVTLRQAKSADRQGWGALLYRTEDGGLFSAPRENGAYAPYDIGVVVDRVGTGDAFTGALIHALRTPELAAPDRAVAFAAAASCLAHSVQGDYFLGSRAEVEALMNGDACGHVSR